MLTEKLSHFFDWVGAEWVMWILLLLSALSAAVIVERILFFRRRRSDVGTMVRSVRDALAAGDRQRAMQIARANESLEGRVLVQGLLALDRGPDAVEEISKSALITERIAYDRYLGFLGTLGNNAPFIGLFGTVLGVVSAFGQLAGIGEDANRATAMMGSISEALVATAIGLFVAIPSVIAYNQFKSMIKERISYAEALTHELIAHLKSQGR